MAPDAELYAGLWEQYQDLAAGMRAIREAVEHAFGATLPPTATLNDELEIITRAIHVIGRRSMPSYSPELIQTMRAALDEVMTKIPPEQATAAIKAYLAECILKAAAEGQTSYESLMAAASDQLPTILSMLT
ncbi:MAG: hypothetical protein WBY84_17715 [Pseudolabrys sp.]|jgi:hypothetical protein